MVYPMRPHDADRTESLMLTSFERRSKKARMLFKCGVIMDRSTF